MVQRASDFVQIPLIHVVESDDQYLEQHDEFLWFHLLRDWDWRPLRDIGCRYYEALWQFNQEQVWEREIRRRESPRPHPETREEADQRLLFSRPILDPQAPVISDPPRAELEPFHVDSASIQPGIVPIRLVGRRPKCFFALVKAFIGLALRGRKPEPEDAHEELTSNPSFARTCGFTLPDRDRGYRQSDIPSLRKLQQFDQIMTQHGLWGELALDQVARNLREGVIQPEPTLAHDTTHYRAWSQRQVVEAEGEDGKVVGKAQSKTTKKCRCSDPASCPHRWESSDPGAGTVAKVKGQKHWAHKASTLSFAGREILLDAVAMTDAATHDSRCLEPHLERFFQRHPELKGVVTRVLDDGAADVADLKLRLKEEHRLELLASQNPRRRKPLRKDLPRGIDHVTPTGTPICLAGYPFDFLGSRRDTERFVFRAPKDENGEWVCGGCAKKEECCRAGSQVRHITLSFERLHWIDPKFPQLSRRFQKAMARRTVIERLHKLMKYDFGDERLSKRGTPAFQARLDKTLLAMHLAWAAP